MNLTAVVGLLNFAYRYFYTPLLRYHNKFSKIPERVCKNLQHQSRIARVYHESAAVSMRGDGWSEWRALPG